MARKRSQRAPVDQFSSREVMLRTLALGGASGGYGFGRYPEGVFASVRFMVTLRVPSGWSRE